MSENIINLNFTPNRYACGHETIKSCLDYSYDNQYTTAELFLLTGGLDFDFLSGQKTLGFNSIEHIIFNFRKYITPQIYWYNEKSYNKKIEIIEKTIKNNNLVTLYIKAEGLIWQTISEIRYPYHMINVYGINTDSKEIFIADQFAYDDKKHSIIVNKYSWEEIIKNTLEMVVYEKNIKKIIMCSYDEVIARNLMDFVNQDMFHGLNIISYYFEQLESIRDIKFRLNSITSTRWLIVPIFQHIGDLLVERNFIELSKEIEILSLSWKNVMLKYLKLCFIDVSRNIYKELNIEELIKKSRKTVEKVIIKLIE